MSEFTGNDLAHLLKAHEAVFDMAEAVDRRVVVELWDKHDQGPVAWFEVHPSDSEVRVTFEPPERDAIPAPTPTPTEATSRSSASEVAALRALAEAVPPDGLTDHWYDAEAPDLTHLPACDAAYIAAVSPDVLLGLLDEREPATERTAP